MLCDSKGGAFEENIETEASGFFKLDELPPLSHRVTRETLELCYQALKDPNWQPVVD
jgi:hypothetical protein